MRSIIILAGALLVSFHPAAVVAQSHGDSFTPTHLQVPIQAIALVDDDTGITADIYTCDGTAAECMVDLADDAALAGLTAEAAIAAGTYTGIYVRCDGDYGADLTGEVTINGTPYVSGTDADPLLDNTGGTETAQAVNIPIAGCADTYGLPEPVTLAEGDTLTVSLFMALVDIAWASTGGIDPTLCRSVGPDGSAENLCVAYAHVVPYVGTTTPALEVYHLETASSQWGQILLIVDPEDNILGGFTRTLWKDDQPPAGHFDTPITEWSDNGDGTLTLTNATGDSGGLDFGSFMRLATVGATHSSSYIDDTGATPSEPFSYTATRVQ